MADESSPRIPPSFESWVLLALAAGGSTAVLGFFAVMAPGFFVGAALAVMAVGGLLLWLKPRQTPARERRIVETWRKRLERNEHRSTLAAEARFSRAVEFGRQRLLVAQREPFFPHYNPLGFAVLDSEQVILIALVQTLRDDAPLVSQKQVLAAIGLGAKAYPDLVRAQLPRLRAAHPMCAARIELLLRSC